MEDEVKDEKQTPEDTPTAEPHGTDGGETDWKAMSRKWEKQAKENKDAADELAALKESSKADLDKANQRVKDAEAKVAELEAERERNNWAAEASKQTGVPAAILRGSTLEEMVEHGKQIKGLVSMHPVVNDKGEPPTPTLTKEQILKIENKRDRKAAIAANLDLF